MKILAQQPNVSTSRTASGKPAFKGHVTIPRMLGGISGAYTGDAIRSGQTFQAHALAWSHAMTRFALTCAGLGSALPMAATKVAKP